MKIFRRGSAANRIWSFLVVLPLIGITMLLVGGSVEASEKESLRQLVQQPVAVDKLIEAGYPARQVRSLSRTLHDAEVSPTDFNEVLLNLPYFAGNINNLEGSVNFVVQQHERGLSGSELVQAFRDELTGQNMAWRSGPEPLSTEYLGPGARNILSRVRETIRDRRGFEEGSPEPASSGQGRTPAPSPGTPGPGGPQGPGSPRGPGNPGPY